MSMLQGRVDALLLPVAENMRTFTAHQLMDAVPEVTPSQVRGAVARWKSRGIIEVSGTTGRTKRTKIWRIRDMRRPGI